MEDSNGCGGCLGCVGGIISVIAAFYAVAAMLYAAAIAIGIAAAGIGIFILAFIIFPFLAYWLIFGLFFNRLRKNLNEALVNIQNLIFEAERIVNGQFLTSQSNLQSLKRLQSDYNILRKKSHENHNSFSERRLSLHSDVDNACQSLEAILLCNSRYNYPEAIARKSFIRNQVEAVSALSLETEKIDAKINTRLTQIEKYELNISNQFALISTIDAKVSKILDEVNLLKNKWNVSLAQAPTGIFINYSKDVTKLTCLVNDLAQLRQKYQGLDANYKGSPVNIYVGWEEELSRVQKMLDLIQDLQNKPHITGAGFFGGRNIEWGEWPRHVVIAGASRSGKSLTIEMSSYPVLNAIKRACQESNRQNPIRAVIFDADGKTVPQLQQIGFQEGEYFILNPFDTRRRGWATGKDIIGHDDVLALVNVLLPLDDKKRGDAADYWIPTGRNILRYAVEYLIDSRGRNWVLWDLFDVIFHSPSKREKLFEYEASLREELYLDLKNPNHRHFRTVLNTIRSNLAEVEGFAALWHEADNQLSIREFLQDSGVLVIPEHGVKAKEPLRKINTFILEMIGMFGIDEGMLPDEQQPNTWIIVDEATRIAPIPRFDDFLTNGLKRGISVIFGFQSYYKAQLAFGEKELEAILEQCTMAALLRMDGKSSDWASEMCRSYWGQISSITLSKGYQEGTSFTKTEGTSSSQTSGGSSTHSTGISSTNTQGGSEQYTRGTSRQSMHGISHVFGGSSNSNGSSTSTTRGNSRNYSEGSNWSTSEGTSENWSESTNWNQTEGTSFSEARGENFSTSDNVSVQVSPQKLKRIEPEDFAHLPETSPESGLTGVFLMRDLKTKAQTFASKFTMDWALIEQALIPDEQSKQDVLQHRIPEELTRELLKKLKKGN